MMIMSNSKNLIPITKRTPKERHEISAKGGRATKGKFKLLKSRKCSPRCPLYDRCIYAPLSKNYNGRCALANIDIADRHKVRYVKLLTGSSNDFVENLKSLLAELDIKTRQSNSTKELRKLLYDYQNVYKTLFGVSIHQDSTIKQDISITDVENKIKELIENEDNKKKTK